jgi:CRP-like cAMP-binding protein
MCSALAGSAETHMQPSSDIKTGNHLLDALPAERLERLQPHFEPVALTIGEPLHAVEHVYFPTAGMISVVATMQDGDSVEIGMVGREGMHSVAAILSEDTPFQTAMVQLPGRALRLETRLLRQEMQVEAALQKLLLRYTQAVLNAVAQSAACNRLHLLEQRCARWLLACHDRTEVDRFPMTHEFLAMMLGVRRPGVTLAARALQESALITYNRGTTDCRTTMLNRVAEGERPPQVGQRAPAKSAWNRRLIPMAPWPNSLAVLLLSSCRSAR